MALALRTKRLTTERILFWRRLDVEGLERLSLTAEGGGLCARSTVICLEGSGFTLRYVWRLDDAWRTRRLDIALDVSDGRRALRIDRAGEDWLVDGAPRPDLRGAEEADVSVTPFCNSLPIRRLSPAPGAALTLDTVFIEGGDLSVRRSRQRYVRESAHAVRYVDLGVAKGFEAALQIDADAYVCTYEGLFSRLYPAA